MTKHVGMTLLSTAKTLAHGMSLSNTRADRFSQALGLEPNAMASKDSDDVVEHGEVDEHSVDLQTDTISSSSNVSFTLLARAGLQL